jgi:DNA-binding MurR/RpiR family transcriptional regulator
LALNEISLPDQENVKMKKVTLSKENTAEQNNGAANGDEITGSSHMGPDAPTPLELRFIAAQPHLGSSRQRLLRQILDEPHENFYLSSREMGRRYGVNSATIVRTIQAIGYQKFADFAHDLRNHFVTQITPYTAMKAATQKHRSIGGHVSQSLETDLLNLNELKAGLNVDLVVELAGQIHRTSRIIVVGVDYAASLAMSLAYGLMRLGCDADAPPGSTGMIRNKVRILTKNDLLIAITFGQGLRETVEAAKQAKRQKVPTFGITDGDQTPIARFCDQYIVAPTTRASFLDSYAAPVAAINAILVACAHTKPKRALEILAQGDKDFSYGSRWYQDHDEKNKNFQSND